MKAKDIIEILIEDRFEGFDVTARKMGAISIGMKDPRRREWVAEFRNFWVAKKFLRMLERERWGWTELRVTDDNTFEVEGTKPS